nr:unnamed protein product [Naegleria fowleri]
MGSYPSSSFQNRSNSFQHSRASAQYSLDTNRSAKTYKKPPPIKIPKNSRELDFRYIDPNEDPPIDEDKIRSFSPPPSRRNLLEETYNEGAETDHKRVSPQAATASDQETTFKIGEDDEEYETKTSSVNLETDDEDASYTECLMEDTSSFQIFSIANPFLYLRSTSCRYSPVVGHLSSTNGSNTSSESGSNTSFDADNHSPTSNLTIFTNSVLNAKQSLSPTLSKTKKRRSHSLMPLQPVSTPASQESPLEQASNASRTRSRSVSDSPSLNSPVTINTNTQFNESVQPSSEVSSNKSPPSSKQKRNSVIQNSRPNSPPPTFSITISSPAEEEMSSTKRMRSKEELPMVTKDLNEYKIGKSSSSKGDIQDYNLSEFKMGVTTKKNGDGIWKLANSPLGPQKKQKKVNFMGPLVDILVHGGLGVPTNHKIRRHSYTPALKSSPDLVQDQPKTPNSPSSPSRPPFSPTQTPQSPSSNKTNFLSPNSLLTPNPSQSKKRELRKSVADISQPEPVQVEPSPKLFVATISKTRRMSLKDENAERLNDLLLRQKLNQYKV